MQSANEPQSTAGQEALGRAITQAVMRVRMPRAGQGRRSIERRAASVPLLNWGVGCRLLGHTSLVARLFCRNGQRQLVAFSSWNAEQSR